MAENTKLPRNTFERFQKTMDEVRNLLKLAEHIEREKTDAQFSLISPARDHICRLAIVYGVAAMDSYFTRKFVIDFVGFIKITDDLDSAAEELKNAGIDIKFMLGVMREDFIRQFAVIGAKMREMKGKATHQQPDNINQLFAFYGLKNLSECAVKKVKKVPSEYNLKGVRMSLKKLEEIVNRRNEIAHACDINDHNRFSSLSLKDARLFLDIIGAFVSAADEIINNKMKRLKDKAKSK